ncbi:hypothetical protein ACI2LF_08900 [Kribbella sp. NPDC020789]
MKLTNAPLVGSGHSSAVAGGDRPQSAKPAEAVGAYDGLVMRA